MGLEPTFPESNSILVRRLDHLAKLLCYNAPWDMKQDNPYLLAQLGFEPTPSLGVSFHIKKDLNAKATEPRRLHSKVGKNDSKSFFLYFCLFSTDNGPFLGMIHFGQ